MGRVSVYFLKYRQVKHLQQILVESLPMVTPIYLEVAEAEPWTTIILQWHDVRRLLGWPRDSYTCGFQQLRNPGYSGVIADTDFFSISFTQPWRDSSVTSSFPVLLSLISVLFCLPIMSLGFLPLCKRLSCSVFWPASSLFLKFYFSAFLPGEYFTS